MWTTIPPSGDDLGVAVVATESVSFALALAAIVLRLWARRLNGKALVFNDYAAIVALGFALTLLGNHALSVGYSGLGQHQQFVRPESITLTFELLPAAESCWACANTAIKLSILHFYTTIFTTRTFRRAAYIVAASVLALGIAAIIQCLAICRPFEYQWNKEIDGTCGNQNLAILLVAFFNLATDIAIIVLPMPLLWKLRMPVSKKIALTVVFGLGSLICVITMLRIAFTFILLDHASDSTYWIGINAIFLSLEPNLGIVNACLPIMKPLVTRLKLTSGNSFFRSTTPHHSYGGASSGYAIELSAKGTGSAASEDVHRPYTRLEEEALRASDMGLVPRSTPSSHRVVAERNHSDAQSWEIGMATSVGQLPPDAIAVTATWDVRSKPAGPG